MADRLLEGKGNSEEIVNGIVQAVTSSGLSAEIVSETSYNINNVSISLLVFEKYYMRVKNRLSLTVMIIGEQDNIKVNVIGSGGGQGALFKFTWGSESSFADTVVDFLINKGFFHR